jgi:hypothetical protein
MLFASANNTVSLTSSALVALTAYCTYVPRMHLSPRAVNGSQLIFANIGAMTDDDEDVCRSGSVQAPCTRAHSAELYGTQGLSWHALAMGTVLTSLPPSVLLKAVQSPSEGQQRSPGKQRQPKLLAAEGPGCARMDASSRASSKSASRLATASLSLRGARRRAAAVWLERRRGKRRRERRPTMMRPVWN